MIRKHAHRQSTGRVMGMVPMLALLLFCVHQAAAEPELKFKDGRTLVWPSYYEKGGQYCTQMDYGEVCVPKSDVASIANSDREADSLYRAPSVTLSEKAQREQAERRKRQDQEKWRSVEEAQRQRSQEDANRRRKHGTDAYDPGDRD